MTYNFPLCKRYLLRVEITPRRRFIARVHTRANLSVVARCFAIFPRRSAHRRENLGMLTRILLPESALESKNDSRGTSPVFLHGVRVTSRVSSVDNLGRLTIRCLFVGQGLSYDNMSYGGMTKEGRYTRLTLVATETRDEVLHVSPLFASDALLKHNLLIGTDFSRTL